MKSRIRIFFILTIVILITGILSASANSPASPTAEEDWTTQLIKDGEGGIKNLSTAFVGPYEVPMLSYSKADKQIIYQVFRAIGDVHGNCGPDLDWVCWPLYVYLVPGTVSNMATVNYIDTFAIHWAFSNGTHIRGAYLELKNDMTDPVADAADLIQISKFGSTLIGQPSIAIDSGGKYELALTIGTPYTLVYMTWVGGSNTSCSSVASGYECIVIDTSVGPDSMGAPSLAMIESEANIAYYKNGALMYAYPPTSPYVPSNCGPGGNTWRCILIYSGFGTMSRTVKLAMGQTSAERGIAFTYDDVMIPVTLYHADYVGGGGNCGWDLNANGDGANRWQCDDLVGFNYLSPGGTPSFSIDIDPDGYSVLAYDYRISDMGNNDLYIVYPNARIGDPDPGWTVQKIDAAPVYDVETGAQASIALKSNGLGFIGYLQQEPYELDDLKIAFQLFEIHLPIITKP